ncbi:MAG: penicillin-binding transpeptidase domain-containing protein, partial [Acidimicrobiia bacterium]
LARFLDAWRGGRVATMTSIVAGPHAVVAKTFRQQSDALGAWPARTTATSIRQTGERAVARTAVEFRLGTGAPFRYSNTVSLVHTARGWRIPWRPAIVHPQLTGATRFHTTREFQPRAPILADDATPLTVTASVVTVGAEPGRLDEGAAAAALQSTLGIDPADLHARITAPGVQPNYFVPITTVDNEKYQSVKAIIHDIAGLIFHASTERAAATEQLAAQVIGRTGPITADLLKQLGAPYRVGDIVGLNGLERALEARLAGDAVVTIDLVDAQDQVKDQLLHRPGTPPQPVRTTLDLPTQRAAEAAIGSTAPAALVAIRPSDGAVRAVVSTPLTDFDRALDGAYPPGSTFKVVTSGALLANGTTEDTPIDCPPTITVNGRTFKNFEGEAEGAIPFRRAFAISCNTAFIGLAEKLPDSALSEAAKQFGFDTLPSISLPARGGSFPEPKDATEKVAAAIGQGRVTASPLAMAGVAATVASGTWHPPSLITDPAPTAAASATTPLASTVVDPLRDLMTGVVQTGTGIAAAVAGQPIAGKTGTAEFGSDVPPKTHAWFIGFRNDLSFAVLVEGGGVGGRVAAPIAHSFLLGAP